MLGLVLLAFALPAAALARRTLETLYRVLCVITQALLVPRTPPAGRYANCSRRASATARSPSPTGCPTGRSSSTSGAAVTLPEPGSGRAWTAVERDGRRLAAIIHDAALDTSQELVEAAAAASALALDNERLRADLQARLEELRLSRARIMAAGDAARRRIERNLHDGAQQQLVGARAGPADAEGAAEGPGPIDELSERLASALAELRELARGIHPAILTDRGLAPAITRSPTGRRCRSRCRSR